VAAWFGGEHEKHPGVCIYASIFDGEWGEPRKVADGRQVGGTSVACWNPVLFKVADGPLMLYYKVGAEIASWQTFMKLSDDGGLTWSPARHLGGGIEGPVKNKPVMIDGTLICPSSTEPDWQNWLVYFSLSNDLGRSWELIGPLNDPRDFQAIQPTLFCHTGGRLQALCRTRSGCIAQIWSEDNGRTWSSMEATSLPNPNSGIDGVTLADGCHLLVYNHTRKGRSPLNVAISTDGVSWQAARTLEAGPGEYSYPAVIQGADGRVHITYTHNRKTIAWRCLDPGVL